MAKAAIGHSDYDFLPGLLPGSGINSNSPSVAIATRASRIAGHEFKLPTGAKLPGLNNANEVIFDEEALRKNPVICKAEGTCK